MSRPETWTPELIADLRKWWEEGHSTAEIGRRLNVSKNAAISKAHRLGIAGRTSPIIRAPRDDTEPAQERVATLEGPTLPPLASCDLDPLSASIGNGPPTTWTAWCDQLPHNVFNAIRRAPHKSDCPVIHQRMSLRLWECTCGVSQPGSALVSVKPANPAVFKRSGPIIVRAAAPEPEEIVPPTIFKPRRQEPCCWPSGEGRSIIFCEEIAEPGRPYCKQHGAKAYTKIRNWGFDDAKGDQPAV
jgi:GcrA cell cycle regulator